MEHVFKGRYTGNGREVKKRALLVIDVQEEYFSGKLPVSYPRNTLPNILASMETARQNGIPVVVIQHTMQSPGAAAFVKGTKGWELLDEIKSQPVDYYVEKTLPSAFVGTGLQEWLDAGGIDTVVISGYMTQFCCDTTARYAMHLGYHVEFLSDATATLGFENDAGSISAKALHEAILVVQAARFSRVVTASQWRDEVMSAKKI